MEVMRGKVLAIGLAMALAFAPRASAQTIAPAPRLPRIPIATLRGPREPPVREYAVMPHSDAAVSATRDGWSLFATTNGRSMDPRVSVGWADDPDARLGEIDAGLGWRNRDVAVVIGYSQPDFGARKDPLDQAGPSALVGFSLAIRTR
jgi:hypothetical protein